MNFKNKRFAHPDKHGYYGDFGGAFIPEMLFPNVEELRKRYKKILKTSAFIKEFDHLLKEFAGRPTPLFYARPSYYSSE